MSQNKNRKFKNEFSLRTINLKSIKKIKKLFLS